MPQCPRCKARTRAGHRCKKRTCKYLPGCHVHQDAPAYLVDHALWPGLFVQRSNNVRISGGSRPVQSGGVAYCSLVASRHVAAGAELLLAYGRGYHV